MSSRKITFDPNAGHSSLLTEVVRAYLHTGTPSALLLRVLEGVKQFRIETANVASDADNAVISELEHHLLADMKHMRAFEENEYSEKA